MHVQSCCFADLTFYFLETLLVIAVSFLKISINLAEGVGKT